MKWAKLWRMTVEGGREAQGLKEEDWTPLLVYFHTSRYLVGLAFGMLLGVLFSLSVRLTFVLVVKWFG